MRPLVCPAAYYQQFDADHTLDVPGEGYGGWQRADLELDLDHTAVVMMHAWDCGTPEQYPGWYRCVEYIPRANAIVRTVFPKLLGTVRRQGVKLFHIVGGGGYYKTYPGYQRVLHLAQQAGPEPIQERVAADPSLNALHAFRRQHVFVGPHNEADVNRGFQALDFPAEARPQGEEPIAETAHQLFALCKSEGVNHLLYAGFAINWCLLMSPGGMLDMMRHGIMCSAFQDAVTAVECKETARGELNKREALWRVALEFGFVFTVDDIARALATAAPPGVR